MTSKPSWDFVPHHDQERPKAPITLPLFWLLTIVHTALRALILVVYRARRHVGYTMYDAPCPRCGGSLWRGDASGCMCLLTSPVHCTLNAPPDSYLQRRIDGGDSLLHVTLHTRTELFHWGRTHDFFADCATDSIRHDDRMAKLGAEPPQRKPAYVAPRKDEDPFTLN